MLNVETLVDFPKETISAIKSIISNHRDELQGKGLYINDIVREDIFDILESSCTVVYYPFPKEDNDGFHVTLPVDYLQDATEEHFVYLNTEKYLEKQVYAAAHELGHIWVDENKIWDAALERILPKNQENVERLMNRFAAEMLMPEDIFLKSAIKQLKDHSKDDRRINVINIFRVTVSLMDEFCVPAQAVIYRFYETGIFAKEVCKQLLSGFTSNQKESYQEFFDNLVELCIQEGGYTKLHKSTKKKGIQGFPKLLDEVEQRHIFSEERTKMLRDMLDIPSIDGLEETFAIGTAEE